MFTELSNAELMEVSGGWNPAKLFRELVAVQLERD